jgi:glycosyltransferase involved in cell wall biosynthesis
VSALRARARSLGIAERVRFLGQRGDVPRLLDAADIHCQPNTGPEPFGIAFGEAMAHGLAVVTTPIGAVCEYLDDDTAVLVAPTPEHVADGIRTLVLDPARRARLGAAARVRALRLFTPAAVMPEFERLAEGRDA